MKTKTIIAAALLVCACTPVKTDLDKYELNCPAKQVTLESNSMELPYTAYFNSRGQLDSVVTRNFDGSFRNRELYSYNSRHELEEILGVNADNESEIRYEFTMDGRFVKECIVFGMNNQEMHHWIHTNDGKHIIRTEYLNEEEPEYVTTKVFEGDSYTEESRTPDGDLIGRARVEYFRKETKPTRIIGDDIDLSMEYNDAGLPVMCRNAVINSLGEQAWVRDLEEHPCRYYSYEYDGRGNWISRAERVHPDSAAVAVLHRVIVY